MKTTCGKNKKKLIKKLFYSSSSSKDENIVNLCNNDELEDINGMEAEQCAICNEFGKNEEIWCRCTSCFNGLM